MIAVVLPLAIALVVASASAPNDPGWKQAPQWGLTKIGLPRAWDASRGEGSVVAVIDSGVDLRHPDLRGRLVRGIDLAGDDDEPTDVNGHGTLIAGIIAATTNNGLGVASVAPRAKVMPIRVLEEDGTGSSDTVAEAIRWATEHGADVINLSLAEEPVTGFDLGPDVLRDPRVDSAIRDAVDEGLVVVVAAGNDAGGGEPEASYDSSSPGVLVVGASTNTDRRAAYSNYGKGLDLVAPGGGSASDPSDRACAEPNFVVSTWWDPEDRRSSYGGACGTSMSVAFVSGAAALLRARGLSNTQIVSRILRTARDLGPKGRDAQTGWGRLDVARALGVPPVLASPRASGTSTPPPSGAASPEVTVKPSPRARTAASGSIPSAGPDAQSRLPVGLAAGLLALAAIAHAVRATRPLVQPAKREK